MRDRLPNHAKFWERARVTLDRSMGPWLSVGFLALVLGCSGVDGFTERRDDDHSADLENERTDQPVEISGAFLHCEFVDGTSLSAGSKSDVDLGCGVYDGKGKITEANRTFALTLHKASGEPLAMATRRAAANSSWHVLARLPDGYGAGAYLLMTVSENERQVTYRKDLADTATVDKTAATASCDGPQTIRDETDDAAEVEFKKLLGALLISSILRNAGLQPLMDGIAKTFCGDDGRIRFKSKLTRQLAVERCSDPVPSSLSSDTQSSLDDDALCPSPLNLHHVGKKDDAGGPPSKKEAACLYAREGDGSILKVDLKTEWDSDMSLEHILRYVEAVSCRS